MDGVFATCGWWWLLDLLKNRNKCTELPIQSILNILICIIILIYTIEKQIKEILFVPKPWKKCFPQINLYYYYNFFFDIPTEICLSHMATPWRQWYFLHYFCYLSASCLLAKILSGIRMVSLLVQWYADAFCASVNWQSVWMNL
jgi:hypothetical protein